MFVPFFCLILGIKIRKLLSPKPQAYVGRHSAPYNACMLICRRLVILSLWLTIPILALPSITFLCIVKPSPYWNYFSAKPLNGIRTWVAKFLADHHSLFLKLFMLSHNCLVLISATMIGVSASFCWARVVTSSRGASSELGPRGPSSLPSSWSDFCKKLEAVRTWQPWRPWSWRRLGSKDWSKALKVLREKINYTFKVTVLYRWNAHIVSKFNQ